MKIYNPSGIQLHDIQVDDSSVRYRSIMNDDGLTLKFSHTETVSVPVGSYVMFEGQRYTLWLPENFKKVNTRNYEYTLVLGGWREALKLYKFKDLSALPYRLKFSLTAKPVEFIQLLVNNMNIVDSGWSVGSCIDASERTLSFNHEYCSDVLRRIAQEWNTEFEFEGTTIHLRKVEKFKASPLALSYGKGNGFKSGVGRTNDGDKQPIGRLYVQGGERNIDLSTYNSPTLLLPKSYSLIYGGKTYRTDAHGMYITRDGNNLVAEDSYDAQAIYPRRVGTVSEVVVVDAVKHFYDIKDSSIPVALDYSDYRIDGEKATIIFQSGALSGREFDIEQTDKVLTGYVHSERRFKIVPQELDGVIMPGGAFVPQVGDRYAIFNISMPASYIAEASLEMLQECVKYFAENEKQKFTFTGELDGIWAKSQWLAIGGKIVPGGHVLFSDDQWLPSGEVIRIVGIKDYVNFPHKPEITLSNAPMSGGFGSVLGKLEADEVVTESNRKEVIQYSKRQWRDARETMAMLEAAILDFDPSISPITIRTMQLIAGDESLQFRFVNNKTAPQKVSHSVTFNTANKKLTASAGIIQHMTLGINKVSSSHIAGEYKFWNMEAYLSPALDQDKSYYLYAKCDKTGTTGTFVLSETPIELNAFTYFYHFMMGIVNSENSGERSIVMLYGFSEILPGRITTDLIASPDNKLVIDLVNSTVTGKLKFVNGETVEDLATFANGTILKVDTEYASSDSATTETSGVWSTATLPWDETKFMWSRKVTYYKSGAVVPSNATCIQGAMGRPGDDADPAVSIADVDVYYGWSYSPFVYPESWTWTTNTIPWENGKYIWSQQRTYFTNGGETSTPWVCLTGGVGPSGDPGQKIVNIEEQYALHTSKTTPPIQSSALWVAVRPAWIAGYYIWTRTRITWENPTEYEYKNINVNSDWEENQRYRFNLINNSNFADPSNFAGWKALDVSTYPRLIVGGVLEYRASSTIYNGKLKLGISLPKGNYTLTMKYQSEYALLFKQKSGTPDIQHADVPVPATTDYNIVNVPFTVVNGGAGQEIVLEIPYMYTSEIIYIDWFTIKQGNVQTDTWSATEAEDRVIYDQSLAKTDALGTIVEGAFVSTVTILLRELNSMIESAGLTGIAGVDKDKPAFWAGGRHIDALAVTTFLNKIAAGVTPSAGEYASLAKIALLHNGGAKIGDFIIEPSGRIMMVDPVTGASRLVFTANNLPTITDLMTGVVSSGTANVGSGYGATTQTLTGSAGVTQDGGSAQVSAITLNISAYGQKQSNGMGSFTSVEVYVYKDGVRYMSLGIIVLNFTGSEYEFESNSYTYPLRTMYLGGTGVYTFKMEVTTVGDVFGVNASSSSFTFSWVASLAGVKRQQYGLNGMMFYYSNNHFHYTEDDGLDVRGKTNTPGTLLSGKSGVNGGFENVWGAKKHSWQTSVKESGNGTYTVYHSVGHDKYSVQITPSSNVTYRVYNETATSFQVQLYSGSTLTNSAFHFLISGANYTPT